VDFVKISIFFCFLFMCIGQLVAQVDPAPAVEGGKGFIQTQTADLYGTGYLGVGLSGIYNTIRIEGKSGREHLLIGAVNLTYDLSDELEFAGNLYVISRARLYNASGQLDQFKDGFGKGVLAVKYRFPFTGKDFDLGSRIALHVPMGANFTIHPFDTDSYGLEFAMLQTIDFNQSFRLHLNEGFRWQGLREESAYSEDLLLLSATLDYNLSKDWFAYSEIYSTLEMDSKIEPLKDRLLFRQGVRYVTPWNMGLNMSLNLGLSDKRDDGTVKRAEDWRILFGISFSKRTYLADDDGDGIPNLRDVQPRTPKGWAVDGQGRALDSDMDGIPDWDMRLQSKYYDGIMDNLAKNIADEIIRYINELLSRPESLKSDIRI
jgi:hypothetical protein